MDLIEFLRARLDEDEQGLAAPQYDPHAWEAVWTAEDYAENDRRLEAWRQSWHTLACGYAHLEMGDDCTCGVRGRVLAEVAAKRAIIDEHSGADCHECPGGAWITGDDVCTTLRLLARPYVDHPDYRQEWKP